MGWLDGHVALAVGGGGGIGRGVVHAFLEEGARLGVLDVDQRRCRDLDQLGDEVVAVQGDATRRRANERAVAETVGTFGRLDSVACFVGVFDYYTPLAEIPDEALDAAFDEMFHVNVKSHLLGVRAAREPLTASRGSIILTLSTSSFYPGRGGVLYVAAKFAVRGLVTRLAHELAPEVRVNGVAPGGTLDTELRGAEALGLQHRQLTDIDGREENMAGRVPLNTALRPEDHAGAYVYLASDRSRGVTGTVVQSDGGIGIRG